ncbi:proline-rich receptor-like protein kinase PERK9 [Amphibalanus amphitrite]|uniref:proline-rich receptor-like protein kinase PERK9 n=1 Tax=Amphibalanus amphitrite TaxID=1232801 RepID=UPI001C90C62D|nr:proline-rich receptor-like protein kinase PERK9 [Amphibalanus amphitrite]
MAEELRHSARRLNADELWHCIQRKFEALRRRPGYFTRLADSMTRRLREVIDAEGSWTRQRYRREQQAARRQLQSQANRPCLEPKQQEQPPPQQLPPPQQPEPGRSGMLRLARSPGPSPPSSSEPPKLKLPGLETAAAPELEPSAALETEAASEPAAAPELEPSAALETEAASEPAAAPELEPSAALETEASSKPAAAPELEPAEPAAIREQEQPPPQQLPPPQQPEPGRSGILRLARSPGPSPPGPSGTAAAIEQPPTALAPVIPIPMSEDGQAFSWFTMANKTLGTYGAALVVVTKTVQEALTYFVQHLWHLIVAELPKYADSQRLLVAARTSTAVLDRALKAAADVVGGVAPHLVVRFKNSMNRAFHNIEDRELRESGALTQSAEFVVC